MKELPLVKIGQVWKDNDPRVGDRRITVVSIVDGKATVRSSVRGRTSQIKLERFNPNRMTGYTLIEDV